MNGKPKNPKRPSPWAVRGVSQEARSAAASAARRAELPLGVWLDRAIREAIKADRAQAAPAPRLEETLAKLAETIERQNARLEAVEQERPPKETAPDLGTFGQRLRWLFRGR